MNTLDKLYVSAQIRAGIMKEKIKNFMSEQRGISNIASTILLLLIVVLVIGLFWGRLQTWLNSTMDTVFDAELPSAGTGGTGGTGGAGGGF